MATGARDLSCDFTHVDAGVAWPRLRVMEWMLQVVDEIDDAVGALRMVALGLRPEVALVLAGSVSAGALYAAIMSSAG